MGNHITFAHCNFIVPDKFETKFCEKRISIESYAWRHYKLHPSETDSTCIDLQEQVDCHESVSTIISTFEQRTYLPCAGLNKVKMPHAESLDIDIKAPTLNSTEFEKYLNKTVLAQEIFLQCPRCKVRSRQFQVPVNKEDTCVVKLNTTKKGFPAFAEDCDDIIPIMHASKNCPKP
uniref:Vitellogenin n=1 Tax=Panagrolaimus sp. PS1159 TaxID=55785 RepID=A0AC35G0F8_9BILA